MDYIDLCKLNTGLIIEGRKSAHEYTPEDFSGDWKKAIAILQRKGASVEDIAMVLSPRSIKESQEMVAGMNGAGEGDWRSQLLSAKESYELGVTFEKTGRLLKDNEDVDLLPLYGRVTSKVANQSSGLTLASQIKYEQYRPFMKSGFAPIDNILGGIPTDGPIILYGLTGVGKSHFAAMLTAAHLNQHKKKTGGIYTLEMSAEHYLNREVAMYPELRTCLDRLYVSGSVRNIEELVAEVTTKRLDWVVIDDMDGLVTDESASAYQSVYKRVKEISRFLKIPVLDLAQPNRAAKLGGRFLRSYDISWSGAGENSAALLIALQTTNALDMDEDDIFPLDDEDRDYIIFWKSRDGWPIQMGPGAIRLEKREKGKLWSGKPYKDKLWMPGSAKAQKIVPKEKTNGKRTRR